MSVANPTLPRRAPTVSARLVAFGPAQGGVGDSFRMTMDTASREDGLDVTAFTVRESDWAALEGLRTAWRRRHDAALASAVHIEFGSNDRTVFWLAAALVHLRRDITLVIHDHPLLVSQPAAGILPVSRRWSRRVGHRVLSPLFDGPLKRMLLRRAGALCVFSPDAAEGWQEMAGGNAHVIPHGDVSRSSRATPPSQSDYALFAGYVGPSKGLDILLSAWARLPEHPSLRLVIAGDTARVDDARLQDLLRESSKWTRSPELLGFVKTEEALQELIANAAIVLLPYRRSSPASGILVRAMAEGRAVLGSRVPALTAAIREGVDGLLAEPGDERDLAEKLERLVSDPALRDQLGHRAYARAAELFSSERQLVALQAAYATAAQRAGPRRIRG